jgi:solute carrier family 66, member 2
VSVIANWLAGDCLKMFWFFNATTEIPLAFKLCGIFQMCCDVFLGVQFWYYGTGELVNIGHISRTNGIGNFPTSLTPTPIGEKDTRLE